MLQKGMILVLGVICYQHPLMAQVASKIERVTVYLTNGAQITRTAKTELPSGNTTLRFSGLSPYINSNSIQVNASNAVLISVVKQQNFLENIPNRKEVQLLEKMFDDLNDSLQTAQVYLNATQENLSLLAAAKEGLKNAESFDVTNIGELFDVHDAKIRTLLLRRHKEEKEVEEIKKKIEAISNQLHILGNTLQTPNHEIVIILQNEKSTPVKSTITLSYMVYQANWTPSYLIRSSDINSPIQLEMIAHVEQNTKEDWNNVELSLSSSDPTESAILPELQPYYLYIDEYQSPTHSSAKLLLDKKEYEMPQNITPMYAITEAQTNDIHPKTIPLKYDTKKSITSRTMTIKTPYTILSGNEPTKVDIDAFPLEAKFEYYAIPKLRPSVFLVAQIIDWEKYELIPGNATIFFGNNFVGTTYIDPSRILDTLTISLGVDRGISIERKRIHDFSRKTTLLSDKKTITKQWEISLKNNKQLPITVKVYDQIPVSQDKQIQIELIKNSYEGASVDGTFGKLTWLIEGLEPQASKKIAFAYKVVFPKDLFLAIE